MASNPSPLPRPSSPVSGDVELLERLAAARRDLLGQVGQRIIGQRDVLDGILTAIFSGGHALLVGVPGLAKTLMVQTVAEALDLQFSRIQFTPDLMPSDITGTEIIEEDVATGKRGFRSEEHTSELQSLTNLVCRLLLEKKKYRTVITK